MKLENHQQLHFTFCESYIYQGNALLKSDVKKQLSLIFLNISPSFTFIKNRIKLKIIYELLYYTFLESFSIQQYI